VQRTAEEIAEDARRRRRQRLNPIEPFLLALGLMLVLLLLERGAQVERFSSPAFVVTFLIAFASLYIPRVVLGRYIVIARLLNPPSSPMPDMICVRCHKLQGESKSNICTCGGSLERVENWRWITDK